MRAEVALLSASVEVRRRAARRCRTALSLAWTAGFDDDARVRAVAVSGVVDERVIAYCATDVAPLVRAAAYRAAGRARAALDVLATAVVAEPIWWARRRAVVALKRFLPGSIDVVAVALADPFWRVRHAAVGVVLGGGDDVVRAVCDIAPTSESHAAALRYIERKRSGADDELRLIPNRFASTDPCSTKTPPS